MAESDPARAKRTKRPPKSQVRALRSKIASDIGKRLIALRDELARKRGEKVTLAEVCAAINAAAPQLSDYESGKKIPGAAMLDRLADFYDVSTDYLIRGSESDRARSRGNRAIGNIIALIEKLTPEQLAMIRSSAESFARLNEHTSKA